MSTVRTKLTENGRVLLPAEFRKALELAPGDEVIVSLKDGEIRITTVQQAIRRAQELLRRFVPPGRMLSEELIAERRAEAARE